MADADDEPMLAEDEAPRDDPTVVASELHKMKFDAFDPELAEEQQEVKEKSPAEEAKLLAELQARAGAERASFREAGEFWQLACLRARKYNLERAIDLVDNFVAFRREFEIDTRPPATCDRVQAQLRLGFFRAYGTRDRKGRFLLHVDVSRNDRATYATEDTVRSIYAVLEYLLRKFPESQVRGVVVVNNMTDTRFSDFNLAVWKVMLRAFSSTLPLRFGGSYVLRPTTVVRVALPVLRLVMKKKLADRIRLVADEAALRDYVHPDNLLTEFGGTHPFDDAAFVKDVRTTTAPHAS